MPRMPIAYALLLLSALAPCGTAQTIREDFAGQSNGLLPAERWELGGLGWRVVNGRLQCEPGGRTTAVPKAAPYAAEMTFEALMRPERSAGTEWKTAGIAVEGNGANYWQLSLVEGPDSSGSKRTVEMHQMLRGHWLANLEGPTALRRTAEENGAFAWEYGRTYRLRIALTPAGIAGAIEEIGSDRRYVVGYAFSGDCVRVGRPALAASALAVSYASCHAEVTETGVPAVSPAPPGYDLAPMSAIRSKATGFFRVEQIGGRWWVVDPKGAAFYVVGTDHVNYRAHWCEKLGYAPYSKNVQAKYENEAAWAASATSRLKEWGFNALGAGHSESTRYRGLAHTVFLSLGAAFTAHGDIAPRTTWTGFPDVFDPRWAEFCTIEARKQCAPNRDDPWLLGYFIDNELEWFGKNGTETGLVDEMMKKPAGHPAKEAFVNMLRERYSTIAALNRAWASGFGSFDEVAALSELPPPKGEAMRDRRDFVRLIAERYFSVACDAIRKADPNHMILGCRFAGFAPPIWDIAGRHLDIVTVNYYGNVDLERGLTTDMPEAMARYHRESRRPLLITEWSFPALDAGLPSRHGAGQRVPTQKDKARAYAIYQTALFSMPYMVGSDYFMWVDEPELGISSTFPEDSNYGLVDVNDRPWPELTSTAARVNRKAVALHSGVTAEVAAQIVSGRVRVRNSGVKEARFVADVWVQGRHASHVLRIPAGRTQALPFKATGPALVMVDLDRAGALAERRLDDNRAWKIVGDAPSGPHITVANAGETALTDVPIAVPLGRNGRLFAVTDASGKPLTSQIDRLPTGDELAFLAPKLPARAVSVFGLKPNGAGVSRVSKGAADGFRFAGALTLAWNGAGGNLLDSVRMGDLPMGRLTVLAHQVNGQPLWTEPNRTAEATTHAGPVRTVRLAKVAGGGAADGARTMVDAAGVYAPRTGVPGRFTIGARLDCYPGELWFDLRVDSVSNDDDEAWRLESYFVYPLSSIGGSAADDTPGGTGDAPRWYDARADASYGALMDTRSFKGSFWKDTPDGEGLHADIYRTVQRTLKPGTAFEPKPPDPIVRVFATHGDSAAADSAAMARLKALRALEVRAGGLR